MEYASHSASSSDRLKDAPSDPGTVHLAPTLAFTLESSGPDTPPRVVWRGVDERSAAELQAAYRLDEDHAEREDLDRSRVAEAMTWLRVLLAGREVPKAEVLKAARPEGVSTRAIERAFRKLGGISAIQGFQGGALWSLPETANPTIPSTPASSARLAMSAARPDLGETGPRNNVGSGAGDATLPLFDGGGEAGEAGETGEAGAPRVLGRFGPGEDPSRAVA